MIDHLARFLGMEVETVKRANLYKLGQVTPRGYTLNTEGFKKALLSHFYLFNSSQFTL